MRYVASEDCKVKGPGRAVLWVVAYHADRDTGECWVGQRRLARESGLARSTVQRALDELFSGGVLEYVEDHRGPRPDRYQIAPNLVEGEASASGIVEGQAIVGEVIHNPRSSGLAPGPLDLSVEELVDRFGGASGPTAGRLPSLVDRSGDASGPMGTFPIETLTSANADLSESQGYKQGSCTSREEHVVDDADSTANAADVVDAAEAPPVDPSVIDNLRRRGLMRLPHEPGPRGNDAPTRSREEQLAILERIAAEDEAKAKNGQEGKESA
jgi:hypothetical protein